MIKISGSVGGEENNRIKLMITIEGIRMIIDVIKKAEELKKK